MRNKILEMVDAFTEQPDNAAICILKEGDRFSSLIVSEEQKTISNMFANLMLDHPEFMTICFEAIVKIQEINLKKLSNNEK